MVLILMTDRGPSFSTANALRDYPRLDGLSNTRVWENQTSTMGVRIPAQGDERGEDSRPSKQPDGKPFVVSLGEAARAAERDA